MNITSTPTKVDQIMVIAAADIKNELQQPRMQWSLKEALEAVSDPRVLRTMVTLKLAKIRGDDDGSALSAYVDQLIDPPALGSQAAQLKNEIAKHSKDMSAPNEYATQRIDDYFFLRNGLASSMLVKWAEDDGSRDLKGRVAYKQERYEHAKRNFREEVFDRTILPMIDEAIHKASLVSQDSKKLHAENRGLPSSDVQYVGMQF